MDEIEEGEKEKTDHETTVGKNKPVYLGQEDSFLSNGHLGALEESVGQQRAGTLKLNDVREMASSKILCRRSCRYAAVRYDAVSSFLHDGVGWFANDHIRCILSCMEAGTSRRSQTEILSCMYAGTCLQDEMKRKMCLALYNPRILCL